MNKLWYCCVVLSISVLVVVSYGAIASAHVLVTSTDNSSGTVLHITPDDDPIAGESAHIFFDVQDNQLANGSYHVSLTIGNSSGEKTLVGTQKDGSYISARYIFPSRGVYVLELRIAQGDRDKSFVVTQRVSRGLAADQNKTSGTKHQWAEMLLVGSLVSFGVLVTIFTSRYRRIASVSQ